MNLKLEGRIGLVAAASKGLGKATALALANEGVLLAIAARTQESLLQAAEEIRATTGREVLPIQADVSVAADIAEIVTQVHRHLGPIDILVNNAGGPRAGVFTDMRDEDWYQAIDLNLMSAIRLTRLVLPDMQARHWGRIINITSISVKQPIANLILSNTARAGVVAMAKTLAGQVAAQGITVNNVCPGYTLTDRVRSLADNGAETEGVTAAEIISRWEETIPARRLGAPEELGALITFLTSDQAAYITGTTIQIDGGFIQSLL